MQRVIVGIAEKHSWTILIDWYWLASAWKLHSRWHLPATNSALQQSVKSKSIWSMRSTISSSWLVLV